MYAPRICIVITPFMHSNALVLQYTTCIFAISRLHSELSRQNTSDAAKCSRRTHQDQPAPALRHHLATPSSPPETNAPADPGETCGRHETDHTSPVSCVVDTAARVLMSQTLMVLSADLYKSSRGSEVRILNSSRGGERRRNAYPERASRPSGENAVLNTQDPCPTSAATAPPPPPLPFSRTSKRVSRLSSEADSKSEESADQESARTVMACAVYVWRSCEEARSKM